MWCSVSLTYNITPPWLSPARSLRSGSSKDCKMRSSFDTIGLSQVSENAKISKSCYSVYRMSNFVIILWTLYWTKDKWRDKFIESNKDDEELKEESVEGEDSEEEAGPGWTFPDCKSKWNSHMIITAPNKTPIAVHVDVTWALDALSYTACLWQ